MIKVCLRRARVVSDVAVGLHVGKLPRESGVKASVETTTERLQALLRR